MNDFKGLVNEFEKELKKNVKNETLIIEKECREILTTAIWEAVYKVYDPTWYTRTYQLLNSVTTKVIDSWLYVYIDEKVLYYTSAVDGRYVAPAVPYWVQSGHDDNMPIQNEYHHYAGRDYLGLAQELMYEKYGIYAEIINDEPSQWF